jgi:hypothetical protein
VVGVQPRAYLSVLRVASAAAGAAPRALLPALLPLATLVLLHGLR